MRSFRVILLCSCLVWFVSPACAAAANTQPPGFAAVPGANVVEVTAREYGFTMPASMPAGLTTFLLHDAGKQLHHLMIARLDDGKNIRDLLQAFAHPESGLPDWVHMVGGPNTPAPGATANATLVLAAGNYVAFCTIPAPDGKPHIMHGMIRPFTVAATDAKAAPLPEADLHIDLADYAFKLSQPISAGHHVIEVTNHSLQAHEMVITRFAAGQGNRDLEAWARAPHGKPAPGHPMGGVTNMAPGSRIVIEVDFTPGHYGLVCFVPDARDHQRHFMHGMQMEFDVP